MLSTCPCGKAPNLIGQRHEVQPYRIQLLVRSTLTTQAI